jgi:6-phosphogluconolactonase
VTLTAQVLKGAMSKHLVITGADKRAAVELARHKSPLEAPIAAILPGTTVHWAE